MLDHDKGVILIPAEKLSSQDREVWSGLLAHRTPLVERAHLLLEQLQLKSLADRQAMATLEELPKVDAAIRTIVVPDDSSRKSAEATLAPPTPSPISPEVAAQIVQPEISESVPILSTAPELTVAPASASHLSEQAEVAEVVEAQSLIYGMTLAQIREEVAREAQ